ncbi:cytochrome P450 [Antrihabitans stalactiti]|uniref:Cytochrome P450 n=1 Tax=Antrihabitans stalactiti TaxID=2584121 RepID=A0A848K6Y1_9NOCA|nr:cytochrome P450 [Antrihabitans stalactiti]NMN94271.1 cytochrome P450 [Antrihabitans stalactiti]
MTDLLHFTRNPYRAASLALRTRGRGLTFPPGPTGYPIIGVLPQFQADPFTFLRQSAATYGDVFRVPMPLVDMVCVNHPDHVAQIMGDTSGGYSMVGPLEAAAHAMIGASIPYMEGDPFKRRRRLITPMFRHKSLEELATEIVDEFTTRIDAWSAWAGTGKTVDLQHEIAWLTMPAFMRAMFGIRLSYKEITVLDEDIRTVLRLFSAGVMLNRPPGLLPVPGGKNVFAALARTRRWINRKIEDRLANPIDGSDLLQILLDARNEDGSPIGRRDLIAELFILIAGGYETVVASTSWTLAMLRENRDAQAKLLAEVDELDGQPTTFADLGRLTWVKACFDEGQRMQGHPFHPRIATRDDDIGGYFIPKYTVVGVSMYALHRDPRWWADPDRFDPTRFSDKAAVAARPPLAFIPFGAGPHRCIGSQMGYMNGQFILTLLHQRYRVNIAPDWRPKHASTFSCTIEGGLPVRLELREPAHAPRRVAVSS